MVLFQIWCKYWQNIDENISGSGKDNIDAHSVDENWVLMMKLLLKYADEINIRMWEYYDHDHDDDDDGDD